MPLHEARQPFSVRSSSRSGAFGKPRCRSLRPRGAARRDCVSRAVADLEQALRGRAAAAREPVAAVLLARELDAELLEPRDRVRRLGGENLDELRVRGLVRAAEDVGGVLLGRVVRPERRPGCRPAPSRSCTPGSSPSSRGRRARPRAERRRRRRGRGSAADHEHVEMIVRHERGVYPFSARANPLYSCFLSQNTDRRSCSISSALAGFGLARLPPRPAAAAARPGRSRSGTPSSLRRVGPASEASSSTRAAGSSAAPIASPKRRMRRGRSPR